MKSRKKKIGRIRLISKMMFLWLIVSTTFIVTMFTDSCSVFKTRTAESYVISGMKCTDKKDYFKALKNYSKAIELNPIMYQAYWERANVEILIGDSINKERAIDDIGKYIDSNPTRKMLSLAYIKRAEIMYTLGYKADACADWEASCNLNESTVACDKIRLHCKQ